MPDQLPSLTDQHWRLTLSSKNPDAIARDMVEAIADGHDWRFAVLMKHPLLKRPAEKFLAAAVEYGRVDMFIALSSRIRRMEKYADLESYAMAAVEGGHMHMLDHLASTYNIDLHAQDERLLTEAARRGNLAMVEYLLSKDCNPNAYDGYALTIAAEEGHVDVVRRLVEAGVPVDVDNNEPLQRAIRYGNTAVVKYLLSCGADAGQESRGTLYDVCRAGYDEIASALLSAADYPAEVLDEALVASLQNGSFECAALCLKHGADIDAQDAEALRHAAAVGDVDTITFIAERAGNLDIDCAGETALMVAARRGQMECIDTLLDLGADYTLFRHGALRAAAKAGEGDIARKLAARSRADIAQARIDKQAEFAAIFQDSVYTMQDLRTRTGASGETALEIAAQTGVFADLVKKAVDAADPVTGLAASDLYHPDGALDCVLTHLQRTRSLPQFFDRAFWHTRLNDMTAAYDALPESLRHKIDFSGIRAGINIENIRRNAEGSKRFRL